MTRAPRDPVEFREQLGIRPMSPAWSTYVKALYGSPLSAAEIELFKQLTDGVNPRPGEGWLEGFANAGRGGGKDDTLSTVTLFECVHGGHEVAAAPGQRLPAFTICPLKNQSLGAVKMVQGQAALPAVRRLVANITRHAVEFKNGTEATIQTFDDVAVAGDTVILANLNEWALMPGTDASTSDADLESNLRPALRQITGTPPHRFLGWSSSYIRDGRAWQTFEQNYGRNDADVLVVHGGTTTFNPNIDPSYLERMRRTMSVREYSMHFESVWVDARTDGWFGSATVENSIDRGIESREPDDATEYWAAIDQAFRNDRFALAIAHAAEDGTTVLDLCRVWTPGKGQVLHVEGVVAEIATELVRWGCTMAMADQFSFDPLAVLFDRCGIVLRQMPWTAQSKPALFRLVRDGMAEGKVRLLEHRGLLRELHSISGTLLRSGGERIEARGGHDDIAHAAVLALAMAMTSDPRGRASSGLMSAGSVANPGYDIATLEGRARHFASRLPTIHRGYSHEEAERRHQLFGLAGSARTRRFLND